MVATTPQKMTVEEFLKLPEDGVRRCLINGTIYEQGPQYRDFAHSVTLTNFTLHLGLWAEKQAARIGRFLGGGAGIELSPDTILDADLAYVSMEQFEFPTAAEMIAGPPLLVGDIFSPWDTYELIWARADAFRKAGVKLLWHINPLDRTVTVYRHDRRPALVQADEELTAEPVLPGFRVAVADLFR